MHTRQENSPSYCIKAKNWDSISVHCSRRLITKLGHLIVLQLKHSTFQPRGNYAQNTLGLKPFIIVLLLWYLTVAITTILGLVSDSFMASVLG